jgi:hypothetical protein
LTVGEDKRSAIQVPLDLSVRRRARKSIRDLAGQMGSGFATIRDKEHSFRWRVEGNKWYSNGQLANGVKIEEVWERVDEGSATPSKTAP